MSYSPVRMDRVGAAPSLTTSPSQQVRIWAGKVTSNTSGAWTLDISSSNFTQVLSVVATAQSDQSTVTSIPFATIRNFTNSTVNGWVLRPASGGIILGGMYAGAAFSNAATTVFVQVVGY